MNNELLKACEVKLSYLPKIKPSERIKIASSQDIYNLLINSFFDAKTIEHKEFFKIVLLNRANKVLGVHLISEGGITGTVIDIRIIMQVCLLSNCTSLIVVHNHPSGNLTPSLEDNHTTQKIKKACDLIISNEGFYSYLDEGLI